MSGLLRPKRRGRGPEPSLPCTRLLLVAINKKEKAMPNQPENQQYQKQQVPPNVSAAGDDKNVEKYFQKQGLDPKKRTGEELKKDKNEWSSDKSGDNTRQ